MADIVEQADFKLNQTVSKLKNGTPKVKIGMIGDSLTEPARTGTPWTQLLFDLACRTDGYYLGDIFEDANVPTIDEIDNYAVGGMTSHFAVAYLGVEQNTIKKGDFTGQNF